MARALTWGMGSLLLVACATVPPHARGESQRPHMQPALDPEESAIETHMHENREGIAGATAVRGASCGCN